MHQSSENNSLKIALHGVGAHAQKKLLPAISQCQKLDLVGISTRNIKTLKAQCKAWKCPGWKSLDELLKLTNPDIVLISTPIGCHFEDGLKVLEANVHLWTEKAFTLTELEAKTLVLKAEQKDLAVCVSIAYRYHPLFHKITKLIDSGKIGTLKSVNAQFSFPHLTKTHKIYDPNLGGGALLEVGYYPLAIVADILGDQTELSSAHLSTEKDYLINTSGAAILSTRNGAIGVAEWGYGFDYRNRLEVIGESGIIVASPIFSKPANLPIRLTLSHQNVFTEYEVPIADQFVKMLDAFANVSQDSQLRQHSRKTALDHQRLLSQVASHAKKSPIIVRI